MYVFRYPGSKVWTMEFVFHGQRIRETTKVRSKTLAKKVADKRRRELEEGAAGIKRKEPPKTFAVSSKTWLDIKKVGWSDRNAVIENNNIAHLLPTFGKKLLSDIEPQHIAQYQKARLDEGASNRTVNMEVGTLRAILKRSGHWARLLKDVTMLKPRKDVGKALPPEKVTLLLKACAESRSRSLLPMVELALETGRRWGVIRTVKWENVNWDDRCLQWGKDKTDAGSFKIIPLSQRAVVVLQYWAWKFPDRKPEHYIFPFERYGATGDLFEEGEAVTYKTDPTKPLGAIKTAWNNACKRAGIKYRFHDLRHTAVSRMINAGVPLTKIALIVGWAPSTTVMMATLYGHHTLDELRSAVETISPSPVKSPVRPSRVPKNLPN